MQSVFPSHMTSPLANYLPGTASLAPPGSTPSVRPPRPSRRLMAGVGRIKARLRRQIMAPRKRAICGVGGQRSGKQEPAGCQGRTCSSPPPPPPPPPCNESLSVCRAGVFLFSPPSDEAGGDGWRRPPTSVHRQQITACQETPGGAATTTAGHMISDPLNRRRRNLAPLWLKLELQREHVSRKNSAPTLS